MSANCGLRNEVEDICQETWLRVFRFLPSFDPSTNFFSWLLTIANNVVIDFHRRRKVRRPEEFAPDFDPQDSRSAQPDDIAMYHERAKTLERCVTKLPERQRDLFKCVMTPHVFNMPEQPRERTAWLESHLLGLHLGELVAELQAIHGSHEAGPTLDEVLGFDPLTVLAEGLSDLSPAQWHALLTQPSLLLRLQERIFIDGGSYWSQPDKTPPEVNSRVHAQWQRLEQLLDADADAESQSTLLAVPDSTVVTQSVLTQSAPRTMWWRHPLTVSLTTAAAVLVVVSLTSAPAPQPATAWGWNQSNVLVGGVSSADYLRRLATSAEEWTKKRPETREELLKRLAQFRDGCTQIILAKHEPLAIPDREWLRERCLKWAAKLDAHRQTLEGCAPVDILKARAAIDATVADLVRMLRDRSEAVAQRQDVANASELFGILATARVV